MCNEKLSDNIERHIKEKKKGIHQHLKITVLVGLLIDCASFLGAGMEFVFFIILATKILLFVENSGTKKMRRRLSR